MSLRTGSQADTVPGRICGSNGAAAPAACREAGFEIWALLPLPAQVSMPSKAAVQMAAAVYAPPEVRPALQRERAPLAQRPSAHARACLGVALRRRVCRTLFSRRPNPHQTAG